MVTSMKIVEVGLSENVSGEKTEENGQDSVEVSRNSSNRGYVRKRIKRIKTSRSENRQKMKNLWEKLNGLLQEKGQMYEQKRNRRKWQPCRQVKKSKKKWKQCKALRKVKKKLQEVSSGTLMYKFRKKFKKLREVWSWKHRKKKWDTDIVDETQWRNNVDFKNGSLIKVHGRKDLIKHSVGERIMARKMTAEMECNRQEIYVTGWIRDWREKGCVLSADMEINGENLYSLLEKLSIKGGERNNEVLWSKKSNVRGICHGDMLIRENRGLFYMKEMLVKVGLSGVINDNFLVKKSVIEERNIFEFSRQKSDFIGKVKYILRVLEGNGGVIADKDKSWHNQVEFLWKTCGEDNVLEIQCVINDGDELLESMLSDSKKMGHNVRRKKSEDIEESKCVIAGEGENRRITWAATK